jgi:hypothetical protein
MSRPGLVEMWRRSEAVSSSGDGFQRRFEELFIDVYGLEECDLSEYFDEVALQHVADYSFGEPIAFELEKTSSRLLLGSAYRAFVERLVDLSYPWQSLVEERRRKEIEQRLNGLNKKIDEAGTADLDVADCVDALRDGLGIVSNPIPAAVFERVFETMWRLIGRCPTSLSSRVDALVVGLANSAVTVYLTSPAGSDTQFIEVAGRFQKAKRVKDAASAWSTLATALSQWSPGELARSRVVPVAAQLAQECGLDSLAFSILRARLTGTSGEFSDSDERTRSAALDLMKALNKEGVSLFVAGKYEEAALRHQEANEVGQRYRGAVDSDTTDSMQLLLDSLLRGRQFDRAKSVADDMLSAYERALGASDPKRLQIAALARTLALIAQPEQLVAMRLTAKAAMESGELERARGLLEDGLGALRLWRGIADATTQAWVDELGAVLKAQGDSAAITRLQRDWIAPTTLFKTTPRRPEAPIPNRDRSV